MSGVPTGLMDWLTSHADALDTSAVRAAEVLPRLGEAGLFRLGVAAASGGVGGDVTDAVSAIAAVSELSLAAGFVFWGQRTFIEYLLQSPNAALREHKLPDLLAGRRAGATGLSNAMKFLSGFEPLQIKSRNQGRDKRIDGKLPWVTNLQPGGFDVAAAIEDERGVAFVASLSSDDRGLRRSPDLELMALRGTSTAAIILDDVVISPDRIIHPDAWAWLPTVRPAFLGLQCGMSIGLARRSITEASRGLEAGRDILAEPLKLLAKDLARNKAQLFEGLLDGRFEARPAALFRLRIRLAEIALEAVQLELSAAGGKAYLSQPGREFQRRWREAAFIPVITPSLVQLNTALRAHEQPSAIGEPA
ncbi:acyl-CoA/acyl-ACP dehydrogenase [Rhodopseudomonas palustris]|nr:acyl-CoA/acyl-ACP dehydrogenase [Rhodopseudomonas palustris]RIA03865.1 acyl-CoA dehydrogenase [Rhodopseudomonas palustris]